MHVCCDHAKNQVSNSKLIALLSFFFLSGADSTQDLIREGESLARRYAVEDEPTRDRDPTRETQTTTDTGVAAQVGEVILTAGVALVGDMGS